MSFTKWRSFCLGLNVLNWLLRHAHGPYIRDSQEMSVIAIHMNRW